jgi:transcriptional regulator with XRE-family HTH domain
MDTKRISKLIEQTGLKRADIATAIDVSVASLRRWEHGVSPMPDDKAEALRRLAGGPRSVRPIGTGKPVAAALAEVPATALIEELARRTRAGRINETGATSLDVPRTLRSVAFTDVEDD